MTAQEAKEALDRALKHPIMWFADEHIGVRMNPRWSGNAKQRRKAKRAHRRARMLKGVTFRIPVRRFSITGTITV